MMRWLWRPSVWVALSAAVVGVFLFTWLSGVFPSRGDDTLAPLPVAEGDHEIVWLYPATNATAWERFVAAVRRAADRLQTAHPGLRAEIGPDAFPQQTTAIPQVALAFPGTGRRLVFRWYKVTSDLKQRHWVEALRRRQPPPLAIIGGSSSDSARDLAGQLQRAGASLDAGQRPLLLLTTATADRVLAEAPEGIPPAAEPGGDESEDTPGVSLNQLYPGRTFRFCFSNTQMAAAVTRFVWSQDDLRPDSDPVYMVRWEDDSYSRDLIEGFWKALRAQVAQAAARQWCWVTGAVAAGGPPAGNGIFPVHHAGARASRFAMSTLPTPQPVDSGVGSFASANPFEARAARYTIDDLLAREGNPRLAQGRPLLILPAQSQPSRRFLRALEGYAPQPARRFVVATGDALAFNTVYRDRQVAWHIQDLPFPLVFFCHRNPIDDKAGFRTGTSSGTGATGTEDILLYEDIIEALALADAAPAADADALGERLRATRLGPDGRLGPEATGVPLFDAAGNRRSGTGEHVVCLRPRIRRADPDGRPLPERVLPEASIEVWAWRGTAPGEGDGPGAIGHIWQRVGEPLEVTYDEVPGDAGGGHAPD